MNYLDNLKNELQVCLGRCSGIFGEYKLNTLDGNDYLLVHIEECKEGIHIKADFEEATHFSGDVIRTPLGFIVPFDVDFEPSLNDMLELASDEITEGYLLPNNLYTGE